MPPGLITCRADQCQSRMRLRRIRPTLLFFFNNFKCFCKQISYFHTQAPQLPQLQLSSSRTWPVVQGIPMPQQPAAEIVWVPQYYYY